MYFRDHFAVFYSKVLDEDEEKKDFIPKLTEYRNMLRRRKTFPIKQKTGKYSEFKLVSVDSVRVYSNVCKYLKTKNV